MDASSEGSGQGKKVSKGNAFTFLDELSSSESADRSGRKVSGKNDAKEPVVKPRSPEQGGGKKNAGFPTFVTSYKTHESSSSTGTEGSVSSTSKEESSSSSYAAESDESSSGSGTDSSNQDAGSKARDVQQKTTSGQQQGGANIAKGSSSAVNVAQGKPGTAKPSPNHSGGKEAASPSSMGKQKSGKPLASFGSSGSNTVVTTVPVFKASGNDADNEGDPSRKNSTASDLKRQAYIAQSVGPDQQLAEVQKEATNIFKIATKNGQRDGFEKVLARISKLETNQRYAVLSGLVTLLDLYPDEKEKASMAARMRALISPPAPAGDRGKLAVLLLPYFIPQALSRINDGDTDDNDPEALSIGRPDPKDDAKEIKETEEMLGLIQDQFEEWKAELGSKNLDKLEIIMQKANGSMSSAVKLRCIILVLEGMDAYAVNERSLVAKRLCEVFGLQAVIQALFQTEHVRAIAAGLSGKNYSAPELLQGIIEKDEEVIRVITEVLNELAQKHTWIASLRSQIDTLKGEFLKRQPTPARLTCSFLMDGVVSTEMAVNLQCLLLNLFSGINASTLPDCLRQASAKVSNAGLAKVHQAIAFAIRASDCAYFVDHAEKSMSKKALDNKAPELRFYTERLTLAEPKRDTVSPGKKRSASDVPRTASTQEKIVEKKNVSQEKAREKTPEKKTPEKNTAKKTMPQKNASDKKAPKANSSASTASLRDSMIAGNNQDGIKKSIKEILATKKTFAEKCALLEAKSEKPVADDLREYTNRQYLAAAQQKLGNRHDEEVKKQQQKEKKKEEEKSDDRKAILAEEGRKTSLPDYDYYTGSTSQYSKTMAEISKSLSRIERQEIARNVREEMTEALKSRLPALHVAVMEDRLESVRAYLESILEDKKLNEKEKLQLLEIKHGKQEKTAFYRAMFKGSAEMIQLWVTTVLASKLSPDSKLALLDARRKDGLAAFYVAMSDGREECIKAYVNSVSAAAPTLPVLYKERLLKAKRPPNLKTLQVSGRVIVLESTARSQAKRTEMEWKKRVAHRSVAGKVGYDMHEKYLGPRDRRDRASLVRIFDQLIIESSLSPEIKATLTKDYPITS